MPYNTNFSVNINGENTDLGSVINRWNTTTINIPAIGTTAGVYSINYSVPTIIKESDISVAIDGTPLYCDQVFTFGPAIQSNIVLIGAVGSISNTIVNSTNGIIFNGLGTTATTPTSTTAGIFFDGFKWLLSWQIGPTSGISYNGSNIQAVQTITGSAGNPWRIIYNGQIYLLLMEANATNNLLSSYNGVNWTITTSIAIINIFCLAWNGYYFLCGGYGTVNTLSNSRDGLTWTGLGLVSPFTTNVNDLCWTGKLWIGIGCNATTNFIAYNTNPTGGGTWTTAVSGLFTTVAAGSSVSNMTLSWNGKIAVASGFGTNLFAYSYDGITWTGTGVGLSIYPIAAANRYGRTIWNGQMFINGYGNASGNGFATSYNGINWRGQGRSIQPIDIGFNARRPHSITFQKNMVISGGLSGNPLAFTLDGINWTSITNSGFTTQAGPAVYNGKLWVAGGDIAGGNALAFSRDGFKWYGLGTNVFSFYGGFAIVWVPYLSMWVCGGEGTNSMAYSYDGITWIPSPSNPFSTGVYGIAATSTIIAAGGSGSGNNFAYSYNGITWTKINSSLLTIVYNMATNGTLFVAVGTNNSTAGKILYSYNGINWLDTGYTGFTSLAIGIAWNGIMWVATGGTAGSTAYSYNGINWRAGSNLFSIGFGVCWNGTMWVITGNGGANRLGYSYDGINWTGVTGTSIFSSFGYRIGTNYGVKPIPYIQHPTLALGAGNNTIAYSADGYSFIGLGKNVFSNSCGTAFWNGTIWVAGGSGGNTLAYSYDGVQWTGLGSSVISTQVNRITYNGNVWVAVGQGTNAIAYSSNGFNWNTVSNSSTIFPTGGAGVNWNGTYFLATGNATNVFANSLDGVNWTSISPGYNSTSNVATNGTTWVAGITGSRGIIYTTNRTGSAGWTAIGTSMFTNCCTICYTGEIWVAGGTGTNSLAYSQTGTTWTAVSGSATLLPGGCFDIKWNGQQFIAIGGTKIAYSRDGITWYNIENTLMTAGYGLGTNSGIGAFVAPSAMVLNNSFISGNGITASQTLEFVSSDPYFQSGFQNASINVTSNSIYK